jgi:hypothetical protein
VDVLRRGIVGSQARQARLRSCLSDDDYRVFGKVLALLSAEATSMIEETRRSEGSA